MNSQCQFRPTWIGLAHRENAYFWDDGSNSSNTKCNDGSGGTYKNWKQGVTYSDVQKENLNCVAMDREGYWQNYHCTNKFYFLCKKKLGNILFHYSSLYKPRYRFVLRKTIMVFRKL